MSKIILVTGANGQLGSELAALQATYNQYQFIFTDRTQLDLANPESIEQFFAKNTVHYCINAAAYTAVDKAESEQEKAFAINAQGVELLAQQCQRIDAKLLHISTDYVYHNHENSPLLESDRKQPRSIYGKSKLQGENLALSACRHTLIVRTSWVYSAFGTNFVKTMLRLGQERPALRVVSDQIGSPTYARDLAQALLEIVAHVDNNPQFDQWGVYQYSNEGVCSWYDFAHAIFELTATPCQVQPIESKDYPTPATRPTYSVMNKNRLKTVFGLTIPHWRDSLRVCLQQLANI